MRPTEPADPSPYVAGEAARSLVDGRFVHPRPAAPGALPIITPERAEALAAAHLRGAAARFSVARWSAARGVAIEPHDLTVEAPQYATTPWAVPEHVKDALARRSHGPWYLVGLGWHGEAVGQLCIPAESTHLQIDETGSIVQAREGSGIVAQAVGASEPRLRHEPVTAEEAVAHVGRGTGARVVRVPELVAPGGGWHPGSAQWRLELDREVTVLRGAPTDRRPPEVPAWEPAAVREIWVGPRRRTTVAKLAQPESRRIYVRTGPDHPEHEPMLPVDVPRRGTLPTRFDAAAFAC